MRKDFPLVYAISMKGVPDSVLTGVVFFHIVSVIPGVFLQISRVS